MQFVEANGAKIPSIGLGTWELRGRTCARIVEQALKLGYRHIDTAQVYENEREVGDGLRASGLKRDEVFVTTKVWTTLVELKREGLIRHIGVSNFTVAQLERIGAIAPVATLQPPYSLLARQIEDTTLPYCRQHGIGVIAYSPMASGLLTGAMSAERVSRLPADDWRSRDRRFHEPQLGANLELARRLGEIGKRHGVSAGSVAVAWVLRQPGICGAIVGFRHPAQVDEIVGAASIDLHAAEVAELEGGWSGRRDTIAR